MLRDLASALPAAARSLRRRPVFFTVATATLGIALGVTTTAFGLVDSVLHPAVPFAEPARTFWLMRWGASDRVHPGASNDEVYQAVGRAPAFDAIARSTAEPVLVQVGGRSARRRLAPVSLNFFSTLGVRPRLGRVFVESDIGTGSSVIVSDEVWRAFFANRRSLDDARISLDGQAHSIVGVMPHGMNRAGPFEEISVWRLASAGGPPLAFLTGHLRAGVSSASAKAQLAAVASQLTQAFHVEGRPYGFKLISMEPSRAAIGTGQELLLALAFCTLFIACANIAALMLARAAARRRDLAIRLSLGASRRTLAIGLFAEVTVVAGAGTIVGLTFCTWGLAALTRAVPADMQWLTMLEPHWSWRLFSVVLASIVLAIVVTGTLPAWQVSRIEPMEPLKEGSGGTTGRIAHRMKFVVAAELATALALLFTAALLERSAMRIAGFRFGFDAGPLIRASGRFVYRWDLNRFSFTDAASWLLPRVEATPGVASATTLAIGRPQHNQIFSDESVTRGAPPLLAGSYYIAGPRFFETMGIRMLEGRDFDAGDESSGAVILDERAARVLFPYGNLIGKRVKLGSPECAEPWLRVIGVARAADLSFPNNPDGPRWPPVYARVAHHDEHDWTIIARVAKNVPSVAAMLDRELNAILPSSAPARVAPYGADFEATVRTVRFSTNLFAGLGATSLALAAAGLFAVLAYAVSQRMREFGVRVALGARRPAILRLVLRDAAEMALAGTAIGAFGGFGVGSIVSGALWGIAPTDVVSLVLAEVVLLGVTMGSALVPALRATRADPLLVIRAT
ncbi:MAG TPA: FtsX-like permease family protein [Gemmatimonadaceae bacterium]|nr:FtsX-like permease family protein [Gemmatimonadaceae bacterium]